jgi:mono/diheme cytochrome c family protein
MSNERLSRRLFLTREAALGARPTPLSMPSFKWKLSNEEVAAAATYIRSAWGNAAVRVFANEVQSFRHVLDTASSARP